MLGDEKEFRGIEFIQMRQQGFKKQFEGVERPAMFTDDAGSPFVGMLDKVMNGFPPAVRWIRRTTPANHLRRRGWEIVRTQWRIVGGVPGMNQIRIHAGQ